MSKKSKQIQDLNYLIIKDKHGKAIFRKAIYSRIVFTFLLIAIQLAIFLLFIINLQSYLEVYLGASLVLSTSFMVYLSNSKGKNEFKITWLVPTVIFPLFGVAAYILYHSNLGGLSLKKRLNSIKKKTEDCLPDKSESLKLMNQYPQIKGLGEYLLSQGNFYPHTSTQIKYFPSGEDFFPDMFNSIKQAKKFVYLEFFIIDVDETWIFLLELLEQKAQEGVEIRVLCDGVGSPVAATRSYQKYMRKKGIKSRVFAPLIPFFSTQQNNRDHRKIVIIDGEIAYTGGLNISNEYMNEGENRFAYWKDNAIRMEGPAIRNLLTMFLQTWNTQGFEQDNVENILSMEFPVKGAEGLVIPYGDDAYNQEDIAEDIYLYIISNAKKYVHITSPYMVIDNQMQEALIFAAHRGVDVSVIVPAEPDHFLTFYVGRTYLKSLMDNGIKVYVYQKGFIHAKTFISDDNTATVGSVNLDYRSLFHHFECGALLYEVPEIQDIEKDFNETLKNCQLMTKESYKKIPWRLRAVGRVLRIFSPLI